jgi:hypothetical protein
MDQQQCKIKGTTATAISMAAAEQLITSWTEQLLRGDKKHKKQATTAG